MKFSFDIIKNTLSNIFRDDYIDFNKKSNTLLCSAIGDSLGMPFETLKANHPDLLKWDGKKFLSSRPRPPQYYGSNSKLSPGSFTDDTQMSLLLAESLIENKGYNPDDMSKRYVDWIYGGKARGYGRTTQAAICNLKNGIHWSKSGIEGSFGNGTAMRAAPLGVFFARRNFNDMFHAVKIDSNMTHRSVEAEAGALTIAITTFLTARGQIGEIPAFLSVHLPKSNVKEKVMLAYDLSPMKEISSSIVLEKLGTGCDVRQTVPSAMFIYWRFNNFEKAIVAAIRAGKDTDTLASITGAMMGANIKLGNIPIKWIRNVESSFKLMDLDKKLYA